MYHRTSLLAHGRETYVPFPAEATGFLYLHASSCSLRFRVVPSCLPEDFDAGRDLLLPNGVDTWCIRTSKLARGSTAAPLRQQVLDDGLVTASTLQVRACIITTLDRRRISDRDLLDLYGHRYTAQPRLVRPNGDVLRLFISYGHTGRPWHFPNGTRGFLYYHSPPNPYDGAIRLRLANCVAEFDDAPDLLEPASGVTWGIALKDIATAPQRRALLDYLVQECVVDGAVVRHLQMTRSIARLTQVFFLNFLTRYLVIELCGGDGARARIKLSNSFRDWDYRSATYEGAALARLAILSTTNTTIAVGIWVEKMLHGPRLLPHVSASGRGGSLPSEGKEVPRYRTGAPAKTCVRKDSVAGRILLQMMAEKNSEGRAKVQ
ncbi:hypothetical protein EV714DRAFT_222024 [Schizophyllum commune]